MSDIMLDPLTGDISISKNMVRLTTSNAEEVRQKVEIRLKTFRGEWFANVRAGLPYFQSMFGRNVTKSFIDTQIKTTVLKTSGVISMKEFSSSINPKTREYSAIIKVITDEGIVVIDFTP